MSHSNSVNEMKIWAETLEGVWSSWAQRNPAALPPSGPNGLCVRACVRARWCRLLCTWALTRAWRGLVDGRIWSGPSEPCSTASFLLFLRRFYAPLSKRAPLPRSAAFNSHTRVCRSPHSVDVISRLRRSHWRLFSPLRQWTHRFTMWNCCWSRSPARKLGCSGSVRLDCVSPRVITFVGGVLGSSDAHVLASPNTAQTAASDRATSSGRRRRGRRVKGRKSVGECCCEDVAAGLGQLGEPMPRSVLQTVNKTIPVQVWNMRLRGFGTAHQEVIDACMDLRMNWSIFFPRDDDSCSDMTVIM